MSQWIKNSVFYHIYPIGFCGCPEYNDGITEYRLDKLTDWIPHLKELGVNALYLGPVFQSKKHGYDTSDYYHIDCRLGDNESFKKICDKLHENGIRIVLDGVFNHVGRDFWAFQDVQKNGQASQYSSWFQNLNFDGRSPYGDNFWYEGWSGHYDLVKLNLKNPAVVGHLIKAVELWMDEFHIDGLRLDAADCIDPEFFKELRRFCKEKDPEFWLMGEIIHGDYNRWANPYMMDSVTNYECYKGIYSSHNDKNYFEIAHSMQRQFANGGIYQNLCLYNFVDNHDVNRIASTLKNIQHIKNVHTLLFTMPGVPSIYYGSEWAIEGKRTNNSDDMLRPTLDLSSAPHDYTGLATHISKLSAVKKHFKALCEGKFENVLIRNEQLVFKRFTNDQTVLTALNVNDSEVWVDFNIEGGCVLTDVLIDGSEYRVENNHVHIMIPANGSRVLVLHNGYFNYKDFCEQINKEANVKVEIPSAEANSDCKDTEQEVEKETDIKLGRYRHFKGNEYAVIAFATDSETLEKTVIYKQLYNNGDYWVRPAKMFCDVVEVDGRKVPRFEYIDSEN
ncbi:MAG: DUF1653 domain-containing protein [Lachnospiraceae bacterium]|nr:DUF1653 domain-containing protein [Lachnospiraceae bacterium]